MTIDCVAPKEETRNARTVGPVIDDEENDSDATRTGVVSAADNKSHGVPSASMLKHCPDCEKITVKASEIKKNSSVEPGKMKIPGR